MLTRASAGSCRAVAYAVAGKSAQPVSQRNVCHDIEPVGGVRDTLFRSAEEVQRGSVASDQ